MLAGGHRMEIHSWNEWNSLQQTGLAMPQPFNGNLHNLGRVTVNSSKLYTMPLSCHSPLLPALQDRILVDSRYTNSHRNPQASGAAHLSLKEGILWKGEAQLFFLLKCNMFKLSGIQCFYSILHPSLFAAKTSRK